MSIKEWQGLIEALIDTPSDMLRISIRRDYQSVMRDLTSYNCPYNCAVQFWKGLGLTAGISVNPKT